MQYINVMYLNHCMTSDLRGLCLISLFKVILDQSPNIIKGDGAKAHKYVTYSGYPTSLTGNPKKYVQWKEQSS